MDLPCVTCGHTGCSACMFHNHHTLYTASTTVQLLATGHIFHGNNAQLPTDIATQQQPVEGLDNSNLTQTLQLYNVMSIDWHASRYKTLVGKGDHPVMA